MPDKLSFLYEVYEPSDVEIVAGLRYFTRIDDAIRLAMEIARDWKVEVEVKRVFIRPIKRIFNRRKLYAALLNGDKWMDRDEVVGVAEPYMKPRTHEDRVHRQEPEEVDYVKFARYIE